MNRRAVLPLVASGLVLEAILVLIVRQGGASEKLVETVALVLLAGLVYLGALAVALQGAAREKERAGERRGPAYTAIIVFSVVFRATLLAATPSLSPDVHRYLWEGKVQRAGVSPYAHAPDDPLLVPLRDETWAKVEHRKVPAVYGPAAEIVFAGVAVLPGRARLPALKTILALADLMTLVLVTRALRRRGLPAVLALAYGWHPLALVEVAGEGHMDSLGIAALLLALEGVESQRPLLAALGLGLSAAAKYLALALVPSLARRAGLLAAFFALAVLAIAFAPYVSSGGLGGGLGTYAEKWNFNATGFQVIQKLTGTNDLGDRATPRAIAGALVAIIALVAAARGSFEEACFATIAAVVFLSPVVHPWYFLWLMPFAVFRRSPAWLVLGLAVPVAYAAAVAYDGTEESWKGDALLPRALWLGSFAVALACSWALRSRAGEPRLRAPT